MVMPADGTSPPSLMEISALLGVRAKGQRANDGANPDDVPLAPADIRLYRLIADRDEEKRHGEHSDQRAEHKFKDADEGRSMESPIGIGYASAPFPRCLSAGCAYGDTGT
jgi:hypothetical protein